MIHAPFTLEKRPAIGSKGMVVTNHPLASAAGAEILLGGGNAVDATVASLFALTVVEPMMVSILGGGLAHVRMADGTHVVVDGMATAPKAARPDMFEIVSDELPRYRETVGRRNQIGGRAVAVPAALIAWCHLLGRHGTLPLPEVLAPAIRLARNGFVTTPYLTDCASDTAADLARDPLLAARFLPGGGPIQPGTRLVQPDMADTLELVAREGARALVDGPLGRALIARLAADGGIMTAEDLADVRVIERAPITGRYRGHEVHGAPPPSSAGVHVTQMLNLLEGHDIGRMGFGAPDTAHLMIEAMKIAFADRAVSTADPAFVDVPVERLTSKAYAAERAAGIDMARTRAWGPGAKVGESRNTTHVTVADSHGNVVAATQTVNDLFGASVAVPGMGVIANNYMYNFDPRPGRALSIAPGKRVFTSMAPTIVTRGGKLAFALGLPGALRIFPSAFQAVVNMIDHGMSPQQAVEAPRLWSEGGVVELEPGYPDATAEALAARGHVVARVKRIAGGMNMVAFGDDGMLTGAACWRADGTPVGISGGLARAGVRFSV